jgi:beta-galactosidase
MPRLTRRDLLKSTLASVGAVAANTLSGAIETANANEVSSFSADDEIGLVAQHSATSPRERLLLDFGWRFQLGHADDATKDFGFGARRREGQFAKSGNFLPVTRANFDDKA